MMNIKSERLKKLEAELQDLEQWQKLGLVPKKDVQKHSEEISSLREKIGEERDRLRFLKESGETEEYTPPKRATGRQAVHEPQSLPDIDIAEEGFTDAGLEMETEPFDVETTASGEEAEEVDEEGEALQRKTTMRILLATATVGAEGFLKIPMLMTGSPAVAHQPLFSHPILLEEVPLLPFFVVPDREEYKEPFFEALLSELALRSTALKDREILSIYFGGGDPHKTPFREVSAPASGDRSLGRRSPNCEITLEANPRRRHPLKDARV